jgi:antitoxin component of MazEF toxin-antitoxin module
MNTRIESHHGGLAIIVPTDLAVQAGLRPGDIVQARIASGQLTIGAYPAETLSELISRITPDNLQIAWPDEPPIGRELL